MPVTYGRSRTARYGNFPHLGASGCHLYRRSLVPCSPALALISARAEGVSTLIPLCCMPCMLTMSPVVALLCSLQVLSIQLLHSSLLVLRDRTSVLFTGHRCVFAFTPSDSDFITVQLSQGYYSILGVGTAIHASVQPSGHKYSSLGVSIASEVSVQQSRGQYSNLGASITF